MWKSFANWQSFFYNISDSLWVVVRDTFINLNFTTFMGGLLYIIALVLVVAWLIGFLGYHAGGIIHILLVLAVIAFLLRVIRGA